MSTRRRAIRCVLCRPWPANGIKARLHHPMVLGVQVWAVLSWPAAKARDGATGTTCPAGIASCTVLAIAVGVAAWAGVAFRAHAAWIGVRPPG